MPRNVRNFWIKADIDGRKELLDGGPASKDGGFEIAIYQRDSGDVGKPIRIRGYAYDGKVELWVQDENGNNVYTRSTVR